MDHILTTKDVSKLIDRHLVSIYRYIKKGLLKPIVIQVGGSRQWQFTLDTIVAFYKGQRTRAELERDFLAIKKLEGKNNLNEKDEITRNET